MYYAIKILRSPLVLMFSKGQESSLKHSEFIDKMFLLYITYSCINRKHYLQANDQSYISTESFV